MNGDPLLILRLLGALALMLLLAAGLARLLGRRLRIEALVAGVLLPLALTLPWLLGPALLFPDSNLAGTIPGTGVTPVREPYAQVLNDVSFQLAPWEMEVRRQLASGRLPFWSDLVDGGSSPWSNPQASVLSPIAMVARLMPVEHHFLAALALKLLLALEGTWVAARTFGLRRPAALLAASGFALGGGMLAWGLYPHGSAIAWAPWCLAAARRLATRPDLRRLLGATAVFLLLFLSGQPEIALGIGVVTALTTLAFSSRKSRWRSFGRLAIAGALAAGLAAPLLAPFALVAGESQRAHDKLNAAHSSSSDRRPWLPGLSRAILRAPLSPWSFGVPFTKPSPVGGRILEAHSAYAGLLTIAGVACALASSRSRRRAGFLLGIAAAGLALGSSLPAVSRVWSRLPLLNLVAVRNWLPLATLALTLAGGVGLDRLLRCRRSHEAVRIGVLLAAVLALSFAVAPELGVAAIGLAVVAAAVLAPRRHVLAALLLFAALLADEMRWGRRMLPSGDPRLFYPSTSAMTAIVRAAQGSGGRAVGHEFALYPGILSTYGLADPRTHNPIASRRYLEVLAAAFEFAPGSKQYFAPFRHPEHPLLDFLGVGTVVSSRSLPPVRGMRATPVENTPYLILRNRDALPRQFLTDRFDLVPEDRLRPWIAAMKDPRRIALEPGEVEGGLGASRLRTGRVRVLSRSPGQILVAVPAAGTKLLATSYPGPQGWRATSIAGLRLRRLTINGAFVGVLVPPGTARVKLSYRPPGLDLGLVLFLASAGILALLRLPRVRRLLVLEK